MKVSPHRIPKRLFCLVVVGLVGCTSPPLLPKATDVQRLRSIEVVVDVPPSNFAYFQGGDTYYAQPGPGVGVGAAVGINLLMNLIAQGIEYAQSATAREAAGPVGQAVSRLDLRVLTYDELRSGYAKVASGSLRLSDLAFPKVEAASLPAISEAAFKPIPGATADAVLYLSARPLFRSASERMIVSGGSWLVRPDGTPVLSTWVTFVGPEHPEMERSQLIQWWADERYRRFIQLGVRAVLMPTIELLAHPPTDERRSALTALQEKLPVLSLSASRMQSTRCPFEADDAPVVFTYERGSHHLRVVARCAGERLESVELPTDPDVAWTTDPQPRLQPPPLR